jgi:hypothetical protein
VLHTATHHLHVHGGLVKVLFWDHANILSAYNSVREMVNCAVLINNQLDAQLLSYTFISILYMF